LATAAFISTSAHGAAFSIGTSSFGAVTVPPEALHGPDPANLRVRRRWIRLAVGFAVAAPLAAGVGLLIDRSNQPDLVLSVPNDSAAPPAADVATTAPPTTAAPTSLPATQSSGDAGLPALGPQFSAIPRPPSTTPSPVSISIDALGLSDESLQEVGVLWNGELAVPNDADQIAWYGLSARPGDPGAAVITAHVSWRGRAGAFAQLGSLESGQPITVTLADGTTEAYEVTERAQYGKNELPVDKVWSADGPSRLVLITCGGDFSPNAGRYEDNIVIYASPID
jgi:hypothetical protein